MVLAVLLPSASSVSLPTLPAARIGPTQAYRIARVRSLDDERTAVVWGRRIRFEPQSEGEHVRVDAVGKDGTVLLTRSSYGLYVTSQDSIVRGRVETPVRAWNHPATIDLYLDARNYAGGFYDDDNDASGVHPPFGGRRAFVVENGRHRVVGFGTVTAWSPGGVVVTQYKQGANGAPANWEEDGGTHAHLVQGGKDVDLGELGFVGRLDGGGLAFQREGEGVYTWRKGRLAPWARLPRGWTALKTDGRSGLLVRKEIGDDWEIGSLRGTILRPLPPKALFGYNWDAVRSFSPNGRIVIDAYQGPDATPFTLTLTPR